MVPLDDPALFEAVDWVLEAGDFLVRDADGLVLLADTLVIESTANGLPPLPKTVRILRSDGRVVYLFRWPTERAW
jgi:hypothetical protein